MAATDTAAKGGAVRHRSAEAVHTARAVRTAIVAATVLVAVVACESERSRRLSGVESFNYRRELVESRRGEISEAQVETFFQHPARTRASIDRVFDKLRVEHVSEVEAERARLAAEREEARSLAEPATGFAGGEGAPGADAGSDGE